MVSKPNRPRATRRKAEVAKEDILDAAEAQFVEVGAEGLRLKDIASDAGLSHSTLLHHFGSRDALLDALGVRIVERIQAECFRIFAEIPESSKARGAAVLEQADNILRKNGVGKLLAWAALAKHKPSDQMTSLFEPVLSFLESEHESRVREGLRSPLRTPQDLRFSAMLLFAVSLSEAVFGPWMRAVAGFDEEEHTRVAFFSWVSELIDQFERAEAIK